jgi:transposase-like protein
MPELAQVGDFCPNKECPDYGKLQSKQAKRNITKYGKTRKGKQRHKCNTCQETFTETKGTIFYRRRTPAKDIMDTLALVAEGDRISSLTRAKGHKEDTILGWLRAAGDHAEAVEAVLLADYRLERGQIDGLWAYVGNKGEKKAMKRRLKVVSFGGQR